MMLMAEELMCDCAFYAIFMEIDSTEFTQDSNETSGYAVLSLLKIGVA